MKTKISKRNLYSFATLFLAISILFSCNEQSRNVEEKIEDEENIIETQSKSGKLIIFYGNSLTAGYGLELSQAFPALVQQKIDSAGLPYQVINAGVSGETSSGGLGRIDWVLQQKPDVFVLELGANDGLRGIPVSETRKNLQEIINRVKGKYPDCEIILAGMQIPPNMGQDYTAEFRKIYPELAKENKIHLIPFLLENVGGEPELNLEDGIHPNIEGQKIVAENVWEVMYDVISEK